MSVPNTRYCRHHHCAPRPVTAAVVPNTRYCRHHHCAPQAVAAPAPTSRYCRRHHCAPQAAVAPTSRYCRRHHCYAAVTRVRHPVAHAAAAAPAAGGDNGMCRSVRIHGEWVQRCHFPGQ